jgi:hypothetical protein
MVDDMTEDKSRLPVFWAETKEQFIARRAPEIAAEWPCTLERAQRLAEHEWRDGRQYYDITVEVRQSSTFGPLFAMVFHNSDTSVPGRGSASVVSLSAPEFADLVERAVDAFAPCEGGERALERLYEHIGGLLDQAQLVREAEE